jgi:hypothetical protein
MAKPPHDRSQTGDSTWLVSRSFGFAVMALGLVFSVWGGRAGMAGDGIAYLDMGDALMQGHWRAALNGFWSPLFPLIQGALLRVLRSLISSEPLIVALTQFLIYVVALLCFQFFWKRVLLLYRRSHASDSSVGFSDAMLWVLGYALFLYCCLGLVLETGADLLLTALVNLSAGIILQIYLQGRRWTGSLAVGVTLGLGFLTKAVLLPLSVPFFAAAIFVLPVNRRALRHAAIAVAAFLMVTGPYVWALSTAQGHFTIGSTGQLNYAWQINNVPYANWQGPPPGYGFPAHPTRRMFNHPSVYEFASPVVGTYPPWDNPTYWNKGVEVHFDWSNQIRNLKRNGVNILTIIWSQISFMVGIAILLAMRRPTIQEMWREFLARWFLWLPGAAAIALYAVIHVESRYFSPFWALCWAPLICLVRLPNQDNNQRLLRTVVIVCVTLFLIPTGIGDTREAIFGQRDARLQTNIATGLAAAGVQRNEKIAMLNGFLGDEWQRLLRLSVVAEVPYQDTDVFWASDRARQAEIYEQLAAAGATTLVANGIPAWASMEGWQEVGRTPIYVRSLKK